MPQKPTAKRPRVPKGKFLLQVLVDKDVHRTFKVRCIEADTTMAEQVEAMMKNFIRGKEA